MQVKPLTRLDELLPLNTAWNDLAGGVPFRSFQWLVPWWRHYGSEAPPLVRNGTASRTTELLVLAVCDDDDPTTPVALAPWYLERSRIAGRVIRFLGSGEVYSDYLDVLCRGGREQKVAETLAAWLTGPAAGAWDTLDMRAVAGDASLASLLAERLRAAGCVVGLRRGEPCWRISLPRQWEDYLATLSKSHRKQIRRALKTYLDNGRTKLRTAKSEEELSELFAIFARLHQLRRESLSQPGCFASARFAGFLKDASLALWRDGRLRLNVLEVDGRAVAADLLLVEGSVAFAYQGGVDPARLDLSPGNLLTAAELRQSITEQHAAFDFLGGNEPYKAHWNAVPVATTDYRIAAPGLCPRVRHCLWLSRKALHHWARHGRRVAGAGRLPMPRQSIATPAIAAEGKPARPLPSSNHLGLTVMRVDNLAAVYSLTDEWNALTAGVPFRRTEWLAPWWRNFSKSHGSKDELFALAVRDNGGRLLGAAPWYLSRTFSAGRAIRFLGSGAACSDYMSILAADDRQADVAAALADYLHQNSRSWDLLEFESIDDEDTAVPELARRLDRLGYHVHRYPGASCWRLELPPTWDECFSSLGSAKRQLVRRFQRRLFDTGRAEIRPVADAGQWAEVFAHFRRLHQERRRSLGESGCFARPEFGRFLDEAGQELWRAGRLELVLLTIDGAPAAAEYNLLGNDTLYYYQAGMDTTWLAERPGHVMTLARIRRALERGYRAVDFLRGDEPYKAQWGAEQRPSWDYRIVHPRPLSLLRQQAWRLERSARRVARRGLNVAGELHRRSRRMLGGNSAPPAAAKNTNSAPVPTD